MGFESSGRISTLLDDENFTSELRAFVKSYNRLKIRLRNNLLIAKFKQFCTLLRRFEQNYPSKLFRLDKKCWMYTLDKFSSDIEKIINKATLLYCSTQAHFKVGHLVQHFLVLRATLSRIIICFKALSVITIEVQNKSESLGPETPKKKKKKQESEIGLLIDRNTLQPVRS